MIRCIFFSLLLCIVGGCIPKQQSKANLQNKKSVLHEELVAKFSEIPDAPLLVELQDIVINDDIHDQIQLFYTTSMEKQDILMFYEEQMERLGWELIAQSMLKNYIAHFSRPQKLCSIVIQDRSFVIYLCRKKGV